MREELAGERPERRLAKFSPRKLTHIRMFSVLALFLLGFLLYNEGIQTVMSQLSVFAEKVLKTGACRVGRRGADDSVCGDARVLGVSWLAGRIGGKVTLTLCLVIWWRIARVRPIL